MRKKYGKHNMPACVSNRITPCTSFSMRVCMVWHVCMMEIVH